MFKQERLYHPSNCVAGQYLLRIGPKPLILTGPRGKLESGEVISCSRFERFYRTGSDNGFYPARAGWRWKAFSPTDAVVSVVEIYDKQEGWHDSPLGALWTLRELVASKLHSARSHRRH